jgi:hypothetical protein
VFLENNRCSIHDDPAYPAVCRGFPWVDAETGAPYQFDQTICPEFVSWPGLVAMAEQGAEKRDRQARAQTFLTTPELS